MQIYDSSSMRNTSGGLPFKLQQKKKSETDSEKKIKKNSEDGKTFQN